MSSSRKLPTDPMELFQLALRNQDELEMCYSRELPTEPMELFKLARSSQDELINALIDKGVEISKPLATDRNIRGMERRTLVFNSFVRKVLADITMRHEQDKVKAIGIEMPECLVSYLSTNQQEASAISSTLTSGVSSIKQEEYSTSIGQVPQSKQEETSASTSQVPQTSQKEPPTTIAQALPRMLGKHIVTAKDSMLTDAAIQEDDSISEHEYYRESYNNVDASVSAPGNKMTTVTSNQNDNHEDTSPEIDNYKDSDYEDNEQVNGDNEDDDQKNARVHVSEVKALKSGSSADRPVSALDQVFYPALSRPSTPFTADVSDPSGEIPMLGTFEDYDDA